MADLDPVAGLLHMLCAMQLQLQDCRKMLLTSTAGQDVRTCDPFQKAVTGSRIGQPC